MKDSTWTGASISEAAVKIGSALPVNGTGSLQVATLSPDHVDASFSLKQASFPSLGPVVLLKITSLSMKMVGAPNTPFVSGTVDMSSVQLAALGLQEKIGPISFQSESNGSEGTFFGFDVDLSAPEGKVTIGDPDGENVRLRGQLKKLHLKGNVHVEPAAADPVVSVEPGGLVLDANVEASISPLVLGSPVQFVGASISLSCPNGLSISKTKSVGKIDLAAEALVLATPSLVFANPDQGLLVQAPMRTQGAATLQFDVASGHAKIRNARIVADHLEAKALDTAKNVSISGITLVSPDLTIDNIVVSVSGDTGLIQGRGLHFVTDEMTSAGPPYWSTKLAPQTGLSIPKFDARLGDTEKGLAFEEVSIEGLKLSGISGEFRTSDGFDIAGSTFEISADMLTDKMVKKGTVSISKGTLRVTTVDTANILNAKADFDRFSTSLDGSKDSLSGVGSIYLHDISVGGKFKIPIDKCKGDGWKVTGAFDIDHVNLNLALEQSKMSGSVDVHTGRAYIVNDGESSCGWDEDYTLVEEQWADVNLCPPWSCHVKTIVFPAIKGQIYWQADLIKLDASATIENAEVSVGGGKGVRVCLRQLNLSPPVIIATYSPQIRKGGFGADLLHNIIRSVAAGVESPIATTIGTSASFTTYLSTLLGTICLH